MSDTAPSTTTASISFVDALKQRYGAAEDVGAAFVNDKKWCFVGVQHTRAKQSRHDRLTLAVLRDCGISVAMHERASPTATAETVAAVGGGSRNEVEEVNMMALEELDLSANVGLPLTEVGKLVQYLPRLATLQLCDIPTLLLLLMPPTKALSSSRLTKLVLNNTGFRTLAQLRALVEVPQLTELHLDANHLTSLDVADSATADTTAVVFPRVRTLSVAHNELADWHGIGAAVAHVFPALTELYLTANQLVDLLLPDELVAHAATATAATAPAPATAEVTSTVVPHTLRYLSQLTLLCLKDNDTLRNPATVDAVRVLCPALHTFRITYSTLLPQWNETNARMYVVAALPTVTLLNRGTVRPKERLDSELMYIQRGLLQRQLAEEGEESRDAAHATGGGDTGGSSSSDHHHNNNNVAARVPYPLLDVLKEKHKDVVLSIQRDGDTATTTGANYMMLDVTIFFTNGYAAAAATAATAGGASASSASIMQQRQSLPSTLTVAKLKALLHKMFQIKPVHQRITYRSGDSGVLETQTPLNNEQETLGYYGVSSGSIIYVEDSSLR
ncbi:Ubiquitin-like domain containing protein [Novymonas esmeraldas]|uniref:Ubiquitin-like domain containing protein n=1 Tax=Novymonas esmeraldas TaxID=1808958 RepID=A0AAW0ERL2_9TRYP